MATATTTQNAPATPAGENPTTSPVVDLEFDDSDIPVVKSSAVSPATPQVTRPTQPEATPAQPVPAASGDSPVQKGEVSFQPEPEVGLATQVTGWALARRVANITVAALTILALAGGAWGAGKYHQGRNAALTAELAATSATLEVASYRMRAAESRASNAEARAARLEADLTEARKRWYHVLMFWR